MDLLKTGCHNDKNGCSTEDCHGIRPHRDSDVVPINVFRRSFPGENKPQAVRVMIWN